MKHVATGKPYEATIAHSPGIIVGDLLFTSGLTGRRPDGTIVSPDLADQTRQVVANLKDIFEAAGTNCGNIVKLTIFVTDIDAYRAVEPLIADLMVNHPASTLIQVVRLARPEMKIEIEAVVKL